ncbi:MAG: DUF1508 domain-containing protein [Planctomycetota bacterium]
MYFQIYQDAKGEWRWRLKAANHQTVATGGEGYKDKDDCLHGIELVKGAGNAEVKEVDG